MLKPFKAQFSVKLIAFTAFLLILLQAHDSYSQVYKKSELTSRGRLHTLSDHILTSKGASTFVFQNYYWEPRYHPMNTIYKRHYRIIQYSPNLELVRNEKIKGGTLLGVKQFGDAEIMFFEDREKQSSELSFANISQNIRGPIKISSLDKVDVKKKGFFKQLIESENPLSYALLKTEDPEILPIFSIKYDQTKKSYSGVLTLLNSNLQATKISNFDLNLDQDGIFVEGYLLDNNRPLVFLRIPGRSYALRMIWIDEQGEKQSVDLKAEKGQINDYKLQIRGNEVEFAGFYCFNENYDNRKYYSAENNRRRISNDAKGIFYLKYDLKSNKQLVSTSIPVDLKHETGILKRSNNAWVISDVIFSENGEVLINGLRIYRVMYKDAKYGNTSYVSQVKKVYLYALDNGHNLKASIKFDVEHVSESDYDNGIGSSLLELNGTNFLLINGKEGKDKLKDKRKYKRKQKRKNKREEKRDGKDESEVEDEKEKKQEIPFYSRVRSEAGWPYKSTKEPLLLTKFDTESGELSVAHVLKRPRRKAQFSHFFFLLDNDLLIAPCNVRGSKFMLVTYDTQDLR